MTRPVDLESRIREKAINAFKADVEASIVGAINRGGANLDGETFSAKEAFVKKVVFTNEKRIGDAAVRKFLTTYDAIIAEYPHLQELES